MGKEASARARITVKVQPRARVRIVSGLTGRMKVVEIAGIGQEEMERRLGG